MSSSKPPDEVLAEFRAAVTAREAMDTSEQATTSKTGIFSRPMYQQQRVSEQHRIAQGGWVYVLMRILVAHTTCIIDMKCDHHNFVCVCDVG